jgi:hypothetical protein
MPTYTRMLEDGRHEYGFVEQAEDRRKDRLVPQGVCGTFEEAVSAAVSGAVSGAAEDSDGATP